MKVILTVTLFLALSSHSFSQQKLSKETIDDFARASQLTYHYDMYGFKTMLYRYFHDQLDLDLSDAAVAVEKIKTDSLSRVRVMKSFDIYIKATKDILFNYLSNMGMRASTAKELSAYIIEKYPN